MPNMVVTFHFSNRGIIKDSRIWGPWRLWKLSWAATKGGRVS
jgi:hypothetical protein